MDFEKTVIRAATGEDAEELLEIYAPYVRRTAITFEYVVPTLEEFRGRIVKTLEKYPYIAAVRGGKILGYAYAGTFKERAAYDWGTELSIYVRMDAQRRGLGKMLYTAIENILREMGVLNLNACIAYPREDDEYLTKNSAEFHSRMGYSEAAHFHDCANKFGRWYDMIWMEKQIAVHPARPEPVRPFPAVRGILREKYGIL